MRGYLVFADQDSGRRSGTLAHDHVLGIGGASVSLARAVIEHPCVARSTSAPAAACRRCTWGALRRHRRHRYERPRARAGCSNGTSERAVVGPASREPVRAGGRGAFRPDRVQSAVRHQPRRPGLHLPRLGVPADGLCEQLIAQLPGAPQPRRRRECLWPTGRSPTSTTGRPDRAGGWRTPASTPGWCSVAGRPHQLREPLARRCRRVPGRIATRGREWLDYFADAGIVAVGMGVLTLRRPSVGGAVRFQIVEEITGAGEVTGDEAQAFWPGRTSWPRTPMRICWRCACRPRRSCSRSTCCPAMTAGNAWVGAAPSRRPRCSDSARRGVACLVRRLSGQGGARRPDRPARRPPRRRCRCAPHRLPCPSCARPSPVESPIRRCGHNLRNRITGSRWSLSTPRVRRNSAHAQHSPKTPRVTAAVTIGDQGRATTKIGMTTSSSACRT